MRIAEGLARMEGLGWDGDFGGACYELIDRSTSMVIASTSTYVLRFWDHRI